MEFSYCQREIEDNNRCENQCEHCKQYYKPLELQVENDQLKAEVERLKEARDEARDLAYKLADERDNYKALSEAAEKERDEYKAKYSKYQEIDEINKALRDPIKFNLSKQDFSNLISQRKQLTDQLLKQQK